MNETRIIEKFFQPLSKGFKGALNLEDDAAILDKIKEKNFVISVDNFIVGIHCPEWLDIKSAITRAVLIAVSDLSAMAVEPYCVFISISIQKKMKEKEFNEIKKGINKALKLTKTKLGGGDICVYNGPSAFCITAVGKGKKINILKRSGAKPKEILCVTGTIGDAKLGLDRLIRNKTIKKNKRIDKCINRFLLPEVRFDFAKKVAKYVSSCIDISDGLMLDAAKLAQNSSCGLKVYSDKIPISNAVKLEIKNKKYKLFDFINAGDDYELAFSVKKKYFKNVAKIAKKYGIQVTHIGNFINEKEISIDNSFNFKGFSHL
tara:strand:- start:312 stop:1265 length:954 start_codon:yes stop_codon:yes gene_type:complete